VQNKSYSDFMEKLTDKTDSCHKPLIGQWELTYKCNLNCIHCFNDKDRYKDELSFNEITGLIDQMYKEGCIHLVFTGGEPLMRPDFKDIYKYAVKKGFLVSVFTNGTLINDEIISVFKENLPFAIEITLHSLKSEVFDAITGTKGSHKRCMNSIQRIIDANLPLTLKTAGMRNNKNEVYKIKKYVKSFPGIKFKFDSFISARHNGKKDTRDLRLTSDEVIDIQLGDHDMKNQLDNCFKEKSCYDKKNLVFRNCGGGINSFHINPEGRLQLCLELTKPSYDLAGGTFRDGFYNFLGSLRKTEYSRDSKCRQCDLYDVCGQCPAKALIENGNIYDAVEYFCELTHKTVKCFQEVGSNERN